MQLVLGTTRHQDAPKEKVILQDHCSDLGAEQINLKSDGPCIQQGTKGCNVDAVAPNIQVKWSACFDS